MTPQINHLRKTSPVLRVSTHIYGISQEKDGKTFIFRVNLGMWPLKSIVSEKWALFWGFNIHLWGLSGDRWENVYFEGKPRHVTPQIDCLGKTSPVLRVSTHIYGLSQEIDGKMFILSINLGMWPLKSIVLEKQALFWGFQHTFMGFSGDRWENIHFEGKPRHVTPQIDHLGKTSTVLRVSTHIYGVYQEIDGKMFTFRVNLGMWPLKSIVLEKRALFWGFNTRCVFPRDISGEMFIFN